MISCVLPCFHALVSHIVDDVSDSRWPGHITGNAVTWAAERCIAAAGEAYEEPRLTCWYGALPYTYARSSLTSNTQVWCSYSIPPQCKFIWKIFSVNVACLIIVWHSGIRSCWSSVRLWRDTSAVASIRCSVTYIEMAATASAGTVTTRPHSATSPPLLLWVWATPESSVFARFLHRSDKNKFNNVACHFLSVSVLLPVWFRRMKVITPMWIGSRFR